MRGRRTGVLVVVGLACMSAGVWPGVGAGLAPPSGQERAYVAPWRGGGWPEVALDWAAVSEEGDRARAAEVERLRVEAEAEAEARRVAEEAARVAEAARQTPRVQVQVQVVVPAPSGDCYGVNGYAADIYFHESGCRIEAVNGGGCAGIGQACPGSKLPCSLIDAPCQLAYFEAYALGRYGSWEAAYHFRNAHNWW